MSNSKGQRADGQLNRSQVITTYGPGAMIDLPKESVLVCGLDQWAATGREIHEPRLQNHVKRHLGLNQLSFKEPPLDNDGEEMTAPGIQAYVFPNWFLGNVDETFERNNKIYRSRPLFKSSEVKSGKANFRGKKVSVTPVRFVKACDDGHLSDLDWHFFLFGGNDQSYKRNQLWIDEGGSGNDLTEVYVRCEETGKEESLGRATLPNSPRLGKCLGDLPWIKRNPREKCNNLGKLLTRSASNAYFSKTLTSISLPEHETEISRLVKKDLDLLKDLVDLEALNLVFKMFTKFADLQEAGTPEAIFKEIQKQCGNDPEMDQLSLKEEEMAILMSQPNEVGGERPENDDSAFLARNRRLDDLPDWLRQRVDRIVLVHRLTEVIVQVGFTRFKPDMPEINGEYQKIKTPPMAEKLEWLPAVENQGEGVFIAFKTEEIEAWKQRAASRIEALKLGYNAWCERRQLEGETIPDPAYYMLHSLSHLLITAVAMECGYSSTAIKERIYASPKGYGILLYTWSPASEGTLGGLIEVARRIERNIEYALEMGTLCSNDPVCAYHRPKDPQKERFLQGAACHGCLLISETCCEHGNELLDRALVIPTVDCKDAAFFDLEEL